MARPCIYLVLLVSASVAATALAIPNHVCVPATPILVDTGQTFCFWVESIDWCNPQPVCPTREEGVIDGFCHPEEGATCTEIPNVPGTLPVYAVTCNYNQQQYDPACNCIARIVGGKQETWNDCE